MTLLGIQPYSAARPSQRITAMQNNNNNKKTFLSFISFHLNFLGKVQMAHIKYIYFFLTVMILPLIVCNPILQNKCTDSTCTSDQREIISHCAVWCFFPVVNRLVMAISQDKGDLSKFLVILSFSLIWIAMRWHFRTSGDSRRHWYTFARTFCAGRDMYARV